MGRCARLGGVAPVAAPRAGGLAGRQADGQTGHARNAAGGGYILPSRRKQIVEKLLS